MIARSASGVRSALEQKTALYDQMAAGEVQYASDDERCQVDFDRKR